MTLTLDDFDYDLPKSRIATRPVSPRDRAKLLLSSPDASLSDHHVCDLCSFLEPGDLLVMNNTKVIPAVLSGMRGEAKIHITLHQMKQATLWSCFAKPAKRLRVGDMIVFAPDFSATVREKMPDGQVHLEFSMDESDFRQKLLHYGSMPIPPYMDRASDEKDADTYQTVYAKHEGAVAAPTAGLHMTEDLLAKLEAKGVAIAYVTLHVGAGTFLPVRVHQIDQHNMHYESGFISEETASLIQKTKASGGRVVALGTTSLRIMEAAASESGVIKAFDGETNLFITPGYQFHVVDGLMTNFHLPKSTLLMLVSAFVGLEHAKALYAHAISHGYRFYSYGDTSLLWRRGHV